MKDRTKPLLLTIALCGCILMFFSPVLFAQDNKLKKVLVLHSYHRGLSWDDAIDEGIESVFKESDLNIDAQIEYMDTKRIHNPIYLRQLRSIYKTKFGKRKFDVIISTDNNALNFLLKHRDDLFPQTPVVFCGVNYYQDSMLAGRKLFSGAVEDVDIREILNTALRLHPETKQIVIYGASTPTYFANKEHLKRIIPDYAGRVGFRLVENLNINEVQDHIRKLPDNSLILNISSIRDDRGIPMPFTRGAEKMASVSRVPIYGCWDYLLGHGIVGGKLTSGFAQGETAARMSLRILQGEKVEDIPVLKESPNRFMFDYNQMTRFGLDPSDLPRGSILINEPQSFYSQHKALSWSITIIILSLLAFIIILGTAVARRKRAEEALLESEERLSTVLDKSPIPTAVGGLDGSIVSFNKALEQLIGYNREEIIDVNDWSCKLYPDEEYREFVQTNINQALEGKEQEQDEFTITCKDGSIKIVSFRTSSYRDGVIIQMVDVTDRKQAEEALLESEEKYRTLIENAGEAIIVAQDGVIRFANPKGEKLYGRSQEELASTSLTDFIHEEDRDMVGERHEKRLRDEEISKTYPFRIINKAGDTKWVQLSAVPFSWDNRPAVLCYMTNITDLKQAEEALRESNALLSSIIESPRNIIILSLDEDYRYTSFNTLHALEMKKVWGVDIELGKKILDYIPGKEDREKAERNYERVMKGEHIVQTEEYGELGNRYSYELVYNPIADEKNTVIGLTLFISDITQRVQAEKEKIALQDKLQRAQKMEAMGLMAGGVAHDLNNILSGIVSYPELLLMDIPEDSPMWKPIKTIQESGMRAADVVEDLLTIARGVAMGKEALDLNILITEYLESAEYQKLEKMHSFVNVKTELNPDLLNTSGSPTHIKKILMNLVTNASEAIEGNGTVTISTTSQYLDEPLKGYEDVHIGEYVVLTISDDGSGISPGDLERIFEPFYTKKMMGRSGTGLGLAVVWNTVQDHNGYINVKSSEKGTEFELYFPVTREEVAAEAEEVPLDDYLGHGEKILVVDDEERQREIAGGILTRLGYNSETVSSGEEAIEYVKKHPVDLIVLDMVMPKGINGRKTYEEIIKIRPGQKAIIASGYAKTKEVDKAQEFGAGKYIKKPYTLPKVGLAIKEELEK